jgi:periplasmic protein TonB
MNRLQKKCIIVSAGMHVVLPAILLFGVGFFSPRAGDRPPPMKVIPWNTVDALVAPTGGNPEATPPQTAPPPPVAQPPQAVVTPPQVQRLPDPPKQIARPEPVKSPEVNPEKLISKPEKHLPDVSTKIVTGPPQKNSKTKPKTDSHAKELAALKQSIGSAIKDIRKNTSPSTTIDLNPGPGGNGPAYANYGDVVQAIYQQAWTPPDDAANDDAITKVTVTISSDGTVLSARILRGSGDSKVDSSVQRTLERVTFIRPFPEGTSDKERTYIINFNLNAKRLLG